MKNFYLFFMLLTLLMNCINPLHVERDLRDFEIDSDLLYLLINVNKMKIKQAEELELSRKCGLDCINFDSNYNFYDPLQGSSSCVDNFGLGNGDGEINQGERGIIRIPMIYSGNLKISNIKVSLTSLNYQVTVIDSEVKYPDIEKININQFSCPLSYYETWNSLNNVNCKPTITSKCTGWRVKINYTNNVNIIRLFELSVNSSIGEQSYIISL